MSITRVLLATLLLGAAVAPAQMPPPPGGMPPHGPRPVMRPLAGDADAFAALVPLLLRQPDLDEAQRKQIHAIMEADRGTLHTLFARLDAANDQLAARLVAPGPLDSAALKQEVDAIAAARRTLMENGLKTAIALRDVLTPAQLARVAKTRTRLQELQKEMRELLEGR